MELHLTLKTPYRRFLITDSFRITTSQGFARIQHLKFDQEEALFTVQPHSDVERQTGQGTTVSAATVASILIPTNSSPNSTLEQHQSEITWVSCDALTEYIMVLAGSLTCVDKEMTLELIRPSPESTDSSTITQTPTSFLKTIISLRSPSFNLGSSIVSESWSRHRDWHLRAFGLGTDPPTLQEVNVRGRLARGQFLADLDGFYSVAKTFEELEHLLERTVARYVKVFRNVLNKQDDSPLTLKQLAYVSCPSTDRAKAERMVERGQVYPIF